MRASESEAARLSRILNSLPVEDVAFLALHPLPRWAVQARRRDERDKAIRGARVFLAGMEEPEQARVLSRDLDRYLASAWQRRSSEEPSAGSYRGALHRIALLNHGVQIGPDQMRNIFRFSRAGFTREISAALRSE